MTLKVLIKSQEHMYELLQSDDGPMMLRVVSGGIAMRTLTLELIEEEVEMYEEEGVDYIDDLAYRVAREPSKFGNRLKR